MKTKTGEASDRRKNRSSSRHKSQTENEVMLNPYKGEGNGSRQGSGPRRSDRRELNESSKNESFPSGGKSNDEVKIPRVISFVSDPDEDELSNYSDNGYARKQGKIPPSGRSSRQSKRESSESDVHKRSSSRAPSRSRSNREEPESDRGKRTPSRSRRRDESISRRKDESETPRSSSRMSRRRSDNDLDPLERKRRQLENLRDQKNLRKFILATVNDTDKKENGKKNRDDDDGNEKKSKGLFSRIRSMSRSKGKLTDTNTIKDEEIVKENDARHHQVHDEYEERRRTKKQHKVKPASPLSTEEYDEAEIHTGERERNTSRPKIRESRDDYQPGTRKKETDKQRRSRSKSRSRMRDEESDNDRGSSRTSMSTSQNSKSNRSRPKNVREHDDDWTPTKSKSSSHLPPTAPKRSISSAHRQNSESTNTADRSSSRSRQKASTENETPPKAPHRTRSMNSSSRRDTPSAEGSRRSGRSSRSNNSKQYSIHSRTPSTSSRKSTSSGSEFARSISNKGASGTRHMLDESSKNSDDEYFVR